MHRQQVAASGRSTTTDFELFVLKKQFLQIWACVSTATVSILIPLPLFDVQCFITKSHSLSLIPGPYSLWNQGRRFHGASGVFLSISGKYQFVCFSLSLRLAIFSFPPNFFLSFRLSVSYRNGTKSSIFSGATLALRKAAPTTTREVQSKGARERNN